MNRPAPHRRQQLDAVADAFLPAATGNAATPRIYAAAPGNADTTAVLDTLNPATAAVAVEDLGGGIGVRLRRLERGGVDMAAVGETPLLIWCPRAEEGLAVMAAVALGRLGAMIRPARVAVLWFAGGGPCRGRDPAPNQIQRVCSLARAALPGASISLHCLGWTADARRQLDDLARRFQSSF